MNLKMKATGRGRLDSSPLDPTHLFYSGESVVMLATKGRGIYVLKELTVPYYVVKKDGRTLSELLRADDRVHWFRTVRTGLYGVGELRTAALKQMGVRQRRRFTESIPI